MFVQYNFRVKKTREDQISAEEQLVRPTEPPLQHQGVESPDQNSASPMVGHGDGNSVSVSPPRYGE